MSAVRPAGSGPARRPRAPALAAALALAGGLGLALLATAAPARGQAPDYHRAEQFLTWNTLPLIRNDLVIPHWLRGDRFWFRNNGEDGARFLVVDPARGTESPLFDNGRLAEAMSLANDTSYDPRVLPFKDFTFVTGERVIRFKADSRLFRCDIQAYTCTVGDTTSLLPRSEVRSPDGKWVVFTRRYNLYLKQTSGGPAVALTEDGVRDDAYGTSETLPYGDSIRPVGQWSPDSRYFAVQRIDQRGVLRMPLYSSTHGRPVLHTFPYALPGDTVIPRYDVYVVDVARRRVVEAHVPSTPYPTNGVSSVGPDSSWWAVKWTRRSDRLFITSVTRADKKITLWRVDPASGAAQPVVRDSGRTYVEVNEDDSRPPDWAVANAGRDVIWWSERDGWGHLYHYGPDGTLLNRITRGAWTVGDVEYVDGATRQIYFTARGRQHGVDPYFAPLYVVGFDGSGLRRLTPEESQHVVHFSPDGRYFTDTYSRVDQPPVTVLRDRTGHLVRTVEKADISRLRALGWTPPVPFHVKARDGVHDVYGVIFKPSDFDPHRKYPVIDHIYPGPQIITAPKWFYPTREPGLSYTTMGQVEALAELGFVVVEIDGMGTDLRSKAWHDTWYGDMGDNGIPDHIRGLRELAASRPWMDLTRVGIYGHSGGAFATVDAMLTYPDFYKVGVASSGNHDNRTYSFHWGEKYEGLLKVDTLTHTDNYDNQKNYLKAGHLRGRLFLVTGDMDANVHPANTLRLVNALIRANKSFDFLVMPDRDHGYTQEPYFIRRVWDFFVKNLLDEKTPDNYRIQAPPGRP